MRGRPAAVGDSKLVGLVSLLDNNPDQHGERRKQAQDRRHAELPANPCIESQQHGLLIVATSSRHLTDTQSARRMNTPARSIQMQPMLPQWGVACCVSANSRHMTLYMYFYQEHPNAASGPGAPAGIRVLHVCLTCPIDVKDGGVEGACSAA